MTPSPSPLLERDAELDELGARAVAASRRDGALVVVEGPAGIGKTALLRAARDRAAGADFVLLGATASELDRDFPFGVVHQLLDPVLAGADPERRERLLAGAAALAEPVVGGGAAPDTSGGDPAHAVLHGLYWLVANLADEAPVALFVDDLHWCDRASLRFLEFLARRLEGLPVLIVATLRTGEPGTEEELLAALVSGPAARVLRPGPLSTGATAQMVADTLGHEPDASFADACCSATGGNPLLLRVLARSAAERGLRGSGDEAGDVATIGAGGLTDTVRRRLAALGAEAVSVAWAVALLGERGRLDDVADLAGLDTQASSVAIDRLAAAGVLEPDGRAFVHPLVRGAVAAGLPPLERAALHLRAARRLAERGARADEIAVHLLSTEPAGEAWVVERLREAAALAASEGAPEAAARMLTRALAEPPPAQERGAMLLDLAGMQVNAGAAPDAIASIDAALEAGLDADATARARLLRAQNTLPTDPQGTLDDLDAWLAEPAEESVRLRMEATALDATAFDRALGERRPALLELVRDAHPGSPVLLAHLALDGAYGAEPADQVVPLARGAFEGGALLRAVGLGSATWNLGMMAMRHLELADDAGVALDEAEAEALRRGSRIAGFYVDHARAYWHWYFGSVLAGEAHARSGLATVREARLLLSESALITILVELLLERGQLDEAAELIDSVEFAGVLTRSVAAPDYLSARAAVRRARGRAEDAEADLRAALEHVRARGWHSPLKARAGLRLADLLAGRGDRDEALELLDDQERHARRGGGAGALGATLRMRGRALGGDEGIATLEEAIASLEASPLRLELAWARHDLGAALRRAGSRTAAREPLRQALDAARQIGAAQLASAAREELLASGARPQRETLTGPESLTPSERRVADLAAKGLSNREIAETLWVTRKTVEVHLGNAYGKLGIRSRTQLPEALGADAPAAEAAAV